LRGQVARRWDLVALGVFIAFVTYVVLALWYTPIQNSPQFTLSGWVQPNREALQTLEQGEQYYAVYDIQHRGDFTSRVTHVEVVGLGRTRPVDSWIEARGERVPIRSDGQLDHPLLIAPRQEVSVHYTLKVAADGAYLPQRLVFRYRQLLRLHVDTLDIWPTGE